MFGALAAFGSATTRSLAGAGQFFVMGLVGLVGYIGSLMDNPFSNILSDSISFFSKAGLLGGGTVLLAALGLVGGALL